MLKLSHKPFPILNPSKLLRKRKIDFLYQDLIIAGAEQTNIPHHKIKKFYFDYLTSIESKKLDNLIKYLEPRFYKTLKDYLKNTKNILEIKKKHDYENCDKEIEVIFNGSLKIFGVSRNRLENEIYNNYTFIKNPNMVEFINIDKARKMISDKTEEKNPIKETADQMIENQTPNNILKQFSNIFKPKQLDDNEELYFSNMSYKKTLELMYKKLEKREFILVEEFIIKAPSYLLPFYKGFDMDILDDVLQQDNSILSNKNFVEHFIRIETDIGAKDNFERISNKEFLVVDFDDFMFGNPHYNSIEL